MSSVTKKRGKGKTWGAKRAEKPVTPGIRRAAERAGIEPAIATIEAGEARFAFKLLKNLIIDSRDNTDRKTADVAAMMALVTLRTFETSLLGSVRLATMAVAQAGGAP